MKRLHYISGLILVLYVLAHLFNHLMLWYGVEVHIAWMESMRKVYRFGLIEGMLLLAVTIQIISGIRLVLKLRKEAVLSKTMRYQMITGLYLAFFLLVHVSAVLAGRFLLNLDTNLYFGAAGLNQFPLLLFFIPYYFFAILSFFGHVACIHYRKTNSQPQSLVIFGLGFDAGAY